MTSRVVLLLNLIEELIIGHRHMGRSFEGISLVLIVLLSQRVSWSEESLDLGVGTNQLPEVINTN